MTLKEADEAAQKRVPVIHRGIEYMRISQTGYNYDEKGNRRASCSCSTSQGTAYAMQTRASAL